MLRVMKQTVEAYIEKQFNLGNLMKDIEAPLENLRNIRAKQVS